jgi:hypothetical protein
VVQTFADLYRIASLTFSFEFVSLIESISWSSWLSESGKAFSFSSFSQPFLLPRGDLFAIPVKGCSYFCWYSIGLRSELQLWYLNTS